jgi:hypothetical protein
MVPRERGVPRQKPQQMHMPAESLPLMRQSPPMPTLQALHHDQKSPKPTPPESPLDSAVSDAPVFFSSDDMSDHIEELT